MELLKQHITGWLGLLACYVLGQITVVVFHFPLPGALTGLLILLTFLLIRGRSPANLTVAASPLLKHMSVLFVPAVLGVGLYWDVIEAHRLSLAFAIVVTTAFSLGLTGLISQYLLSRKGGEERND